MKKNFTIHWMLEAKKIQLSVDEWNAFVETLDFSKRLSSVQGIKTNKLTFNSGYWHYDEHKAALFRVNEQTWEPEIISWKESDGTSGFDARSLLVDKMEESGNGKLQKRFGAIRGNNSVWNDNEFGLTNLELIQAIHNINRCVGPFIGNEDEHSVNIDGGLWKADVKSAYPAMAINNLPDLHTAELVRGWIEPTAEFPIVFYLESHNIAEYGVFDTRRERFHHLYENFRSVSRNQTKFKNEAAISFDNPDEELCLRCKYAECGLPEFEYFYNLKEEAKVNSEIPAEMAQSAKNVMNYSIGTFDFVVMDSTKTQVAPSNFSYFGHLRAVALGRHNHKMIQYYNEIKKLGYRFLCIQTDSLMWQGDAAIPSAIHSNKLGDLNLEIENGKGYIHRLGCYYVEDGNNTICKHQGLKGVKAGSIDEFRESMKNTAPFVAKNKFDMDTLHITLGGE